MKSSVFIFLFCLLTIAASPQTVSLGLRDNQYLRIQYVAKFGLLSELEHSLFTLGTSNQHIQGYAGYRKEFKKLNGEIRFYYGTTYNNAFWDYGLKISAETTFSKRWGMDFSLNPHVDSDYGYKTCYNISFFLSVLKEIAIELSSSNIPEYREATNCLKAGLRFKSGNLSVKPQVSFPTEGRRKAGRILCGFDYTF
jgi:hypothetical protein